MSVERVHYKTVDEHSTRGIIVTDETIRDLHAAIRIWRRNGESFETLKGSERIVEFLESCYNKEFGGY